MDGFSTTHDALAFYCSYSSRTQQWPLRASLYIEGITADTAPGLGLGKEGRKTHFDFQESDNFKTIDSVQMTLLNIQAKAMETYSQCLLERIVRLS